MRERLKYRVAVVALLAVGSMPAVRVPVAVAGGVGERESRAEGGALPLPAAVAGAVAVALEGVGSTAEAVREGDFGGAAEGLAAREALLVRVVVPDWDTEGVGVSVAAEEGFAACCCCCCCKVLLGLGLPLGEGRGEAVGGWLGSVG